METKPFTLRDAIEVVVGTQITDLEREFVDFHNDLRVASVRELLDLGLKKEKAEIVLFLCDAFKSGKNLREVVDEELALEVA